jgi:hypothetical protein
MEATTSKVAYDASHPDALAVYCSDGRFTNAVAELLKKLGYERLDTLTIPGGPALFDMGTSSLTEVDTVRKATHFLVVGHHIKHITLLAHEGCGYYKTQLSHEVPEAIYERQLADLRSGAAWLRAVHAGIDVKTFFARPRTGHVLFETVL